MLRIAQSCVLQVGCICDYTCESCDATSPFLQARGREEARKVWTSGVSELKRAFGVSDASVVRLLKAAYGITNAPREFWEDAKEHIKRAKIGGHPILGDVCVRVVAAPEDHPDRQCAGRVVGYLFCHVDDFVVFGNYASKYFLEVRSAVREMYTWGVWEVDSFRFVGIDLQHLDHCVVLNQIFYSVGLTDLAFSRSRMHETLSGDNGITQHELTKCKAALGAPQWLATRTQPLLSARVGLLQSACQAGAAPSVMGEIQALSQEARKNNDPADLIVVTMGNASHRNRANGASTGRMLTFLAPKAFADGLTTSLSLVSSRSWKLDRVAGGTNDAEMQALYEADVHNYKVRLIMGEILGHGYRFRRDFVGRAQNCVEHVPGLLITDSKEAYDASMRHMSATLGLSNSRAAVQGLAIQQSLRDHLFQFFWMTADRNLSDALTKAASSCRTAMEKFLQVGRWRCRFHPDFVVSAKKGKSAVDVISAGDVDFIFADEGSRHDMPSIDSLRRQILRAPD